MAGPWAACLSLSVILASSLNCLETQRNFTDMTASPRHLALDFLRESQKEKWGLSCLPYARKRDRNGL